MCVPFTQSQASFGFLFIKIQSHIRFGDLVDVLALVSTVFGICTNMGIGAVQLNTGIHRLNSGIERSILVQVSTTVCLSVTLCMYVCMCAAQQGHP